MGEVDSIEAPFVGVWAGDARAVKVLVTRYEPMIQRLARLGSVPPRLHRQLDAVWRDHRRLEPVGLEDGVAGRRGLLARALDCVALEIGRDDSDAP